MNAVSTLQELFPKRIHTKIVGTTFEGRQDLLQECKRQGVSQLRLVPDPRNPYDSYAVAVEADMSDRTGSEETVRLGFLSNSDRVCADCGQLVGAGMFQRSRTLMCGECGCVFGFSEPTVSKNPNGTTSLHCPKCDELVDLDMARLVVCPSCGGSDFGRGGLATRLSRALAAGIPYAVRVLEYTGGDGKSLGCNIVIERID